jgi:hypothetical protein
MKPFIWVITSPHDPEMRGTSFVARILILNSSQLEMVAAEIQPEIVQDYSAAMAHLFEVGIGLLNLQPSSFTLTVEKFCQTEKIFSLTL